MNKFVFRISLAEIAVIILTFAEYSIQPLHSIGLTEISSDNKEHIIKLVAFLV